MPRRPLPLIPRGPRRRPRPPRNRLIFACPRLSPEWELGALHALMKPKPHTKAPIEHRTGDQTWPAGADQLLAQTLATARDLLHLDLALHRPPAGDYHFIAHYTPNQTPDLLALAVLLSSRLPDLWFVLDRLFVKAGVFYRRQFGYKLNLVPASNVHLSRPLRAAIRGALASCTTCPSTPKRSKRPAATR